jgi:hypothetical protein
MKPVTLDLIHISESSLEDPVIELQSGLPTYNLSTCPVPKSLTIRLRQLRDELEVMRALQRTRPVSPPRDDHQSLSFENVADSWDQALPPSGQSLPSVSAPRQPQAESGFVDGVQAFENLSQIVNQPRDTSYHSTIASGPPIQPLPGHTEVEKR